MYTAPTGVKSSVGPSLRTSLVVLGIGSAIGIAASIGVGVTAVSKVLGVPSVTLPARLVRHLDAGSYDVFQRTGSQRGGSGFSFTRSEPVTLTPRDVSVVGADGTAVPVNPPSAVTQTLTRGSAIYTAAARFHVPTPGDYTIEVRADGGIPEVVVARTLGDTVRLAAPWIASLGVGVLTAAVGLVMLIVGIVRRNRATRSAFVGAPFGTPALPPPGWYPDPGGSGRPRWWDGTRWTDQIG